VRWRGATLQLAAAARKSEQASARVQELQEKERQRMESFKRQMGM